MLKTCGTKNSHFQDLQKTKLLKFLPITILKDITGFSIEIKFQSKNKDLNKLQVPFAFQNAFSFTKKLFNVYNIFVKKFVRL